MSGTRSNDRERNRATGSADRRGPAGGPYLARADAPPLDWYAAGSRDALSVVGFDGSAGIRLRESSAGDRQHPRTVHFAFGGLGGLRPRPRDAGRGDRNAAGRRDDGAMAFRSQRRSRAGRPSPKRAAPGSPRRRSTVGGRGL